MGTTLDRVVTRQTADPDCQTAVAENSRADHTVNAYLMGPMTANLPPLTVYA